MMVEVEGKMEIKTLRLFLLLPAMLLKTRKNELSGWPEVNHRIAKTFDCEGHGYVVKYELD